jgi:hypothetical protein
VCASCKEWKFQLRDFPQPLLDIRDLHIWGRLVGAEQEATRRGMIQGTQVIKLTADFICDRELKLYEIKMSCFGLWVRNWNVDYESINKEQT